MLFLLLSWCFIFLLSVSYGLLGWKLLDRLEFKKPATGIPRPEILSLLGIAILCWLVSCLSFFVPINFKVQAFLTLTAVPWPVLYFKTLRQSFSGITIRSAKSRYFWGLATVYLVLLLVQATKLATFYDLGLYHGQFIQWVQHFRVVPGLGNLYGRLAFNSHYHVLAAFFSTPALNPSPLYQAIGTYLYLLFTIFSCRRAFFHFQTHNRLAIFYLAALIFVYAGYRPWISSPMPDSAVVIFMLFILAVLLEKILLPHKNFELATTFIILILLATLITFKLSGSYFSLTALFLLWQTPPTYRKKLLMAGALIYFILLVPWLGRNVILSGYLVYPFPKLDLFDPDWKVPVSKVKAEQEIIVHFARWSAPDYRDHKNATLSEWLPFWWKTQERHYQLLVLFTLLVLVIQGLIFAKRNWQRQPGLYLIFIISVACCFLWFISAPTLRFGYGYLVAALLGGLLLSLKEQVSARVIYLLLFLSFLYGLNAIRNEIKVLRLNDVLLEPIPILHTGGTEIRKNGIIFHIEPEDHCWNIPIPCTNKFPPNLELRGPNLQSGFRITSP